MFLTILSKFMENSQIIFVIKKIKFAVLVEFWQKKII